jgi:hypothetical protein
MTWRIPTLEEGWIIPALNIQEALVDVLYQLSVPIINVENTNSERIFEK